MKSPSFLRRFVSAATVCGCMALPALSLAQDLTPPVIVNAIPNVTVAAGTTETVVKLKKTFGLSGVSGTVVRMVTTEGTMDLEMFNGESPLNVANFLSYVNSGAYNGSFIHRSINNPKFIFQGGGYYVGSGGLIGAIPANAAVKGEHFVSNTRGTVALALPPGADSADQGTSEWFFNLVDNTRLDTASDPGNSDNQGPFTAFARVIEGGLTTMDAISNVPVPEPDEYAGTVLADIPLIGYGSDPTKEVQTSEFVYVNDVVVVPMVPPTVGADSVLALKVKNNNPTLLTATITGKKLKLFYNAGQTGTAKIKVFATDAVGTRTKSKFTVNVE